MGLRLKTFGPNFPCLGAMGIRWNPMGPKRHKSEEVKNQIFKPQNILIFNINTNILTILILILKTKFLKILILILTKNLILCHVCPPPSVPSWVSLDMGVCGKALGWTKSI